MWIWSRTSGWRAYKSKGESTIILWNGHNIKPPFKFIPLYPLISTALRPHQPSLFVQLWWGPTQKLKLAKCTEQVECSAASRPSTAHPFSRPRDQPRGGDGKMIAEPEVREDGCATASPAHNRPAALRNVQQLWSPAEDMAQVQLVNILAWDRNGFLSPHL